MRPRSAHAVRGGVGRIERQLGQEGLGRRVAKRDLLEPYDDRVDSQNDWSRVWEERAAILYRIEDFKGAIRDYKQALATVSRSSRPMTDDYLGIARSYARMGKLKDAARWISDAPISYMQLRALAKEPAFAELAAHPRYREDVFRLDD